MAIYKAPTDDMLFIMNEVLQLDKQPISGYAELDRVFLEAALRESGRLASEVLAPLNAIGDSIGCSLKNGKVTTPQGFKEAFEEMKSGGWPGLDCDPEFGGQGLPCILATAVNEMFASSNMAFSMYQGLTHAAYSAISKHGSKEQKQTYLPKLVSCEWTGTMNLTEPHCGTDLGLMRTKAFPQLDGTYLIKGQKIFISAGDHDLADNIIHLVLAKIEGAPKGIKGVSMFIVPKFLVNDNGEPGQRNFLSVNKIEKKMGIHGNSTCVMNYDNATGYLVGEQHKGMRAMFTMMNEARLGVGLQGYSLAEVAYQNAVLYSRDRLQGRGIEGTKNPTAPADPIIVHADIRRNLMDQKSFVEAARAFTFWGATLLDAAQKSRDQDAEGLISLLTPVIKGFLTDKGFDMCIQAQQIYGGHGYIEDSGMSQFARDCRISMIYEGANGIQALDLVGRKLPQNGGKFMLAFFELTKAFVAECRGISEEFDEKFLEPMHSSLQELQSAGVYFLQNGIKNPNNALAGSYDFMHLFGHVCLAFMWVQMAKVCYKKLKDESCDIVFYKSKIATGEYYMKRQLPATSMHLSRIVSGAETVMALDDANF